MSVRDELHPDIQRLVERYTALGIGDHGYSLREFIADPEAVEARALGPAPLMHEQGRVMLRVIEAEKEAAERGLEHLPMRGGVLPEPLHTRRHPRSNPNVRPRRGGES